MTLPSLPPEGSRDWYGHYTALHNAVSGFDGGLDDADVAALVENEGSATNDALLATFEPATAPAAMLAPYQGTIYSPLPIIVLRIDDTTAVDRTLADAMTARGLVGCFATWRARIDGTGYLTTADLLAMQKAGHEITAHSRTHGGNPGDLATFIDEVVTATDEMRALGLHIQHFTQPGTWGTSPLIDDPYWLNTFEKLDNAPSRILRANFAASQGYLPDGSVTGIRTLPSPANYGANHGTWETGGLAPAQEFVEKVIAADGIGEILTHGNLLGGTGYNTVADYTAFLDWLAAQRDAGRLLVMTPTAASYALRGDRINLFGDPSFETLATTPAYSPWVLDGTSTTSGIVGRNGGAAVRTKSNGDSVDHPLGNASTLRSIEITGWGKAAATGGKARIVTIFYDAAGAATVVNYVTPTALSTSTWSLVRTTVGVPPGSVDGKVVLTSNTQHTDWDDVALYRT